MNKKERIERLESEVDTLKNEVRRLVSETHVDSRNEEWFGLTRYRPTLKEHVQDVAERSDRQGLVVDAILKHLGLEFHQVVDESVNGVSRYNELRPVDKKK